MCALEDVNLHLLHTENVLYLLRKALYHVLVSISDVLKCRSSLLQSLECMFLRRDNIFQRADFLF